MSTPRKYCVTFISKTAAGMRDGLSVYHPARPEFYQPLDRAGWLVKLYRPHPDRRVQQLQPPIIRMPSPEPAIQNRPAAAVPPAAGEFHSGLPGKPFPTPNPLTTLGPPRPGEHLQYGFHPDCYNGHLEVGRLP